MKYKEIDKLKLKDKFTLYESITNRYRGKKELSIIQSYVEKYGLERGIQVFAPEASTISLVNGVLTIRFRSKDAFSAVKETPGFFKKIKNYYAKVILEEDF